MYACFGWLRRLVVGRPELFLSMESHTFAYYCRFVLSVTFFMLAVRIACLVKGVLRNKQIRHN